MTQYRGGCAKCPKLYRSFKSKPQSIPDWVNIESLLYYDSENCNMLCGGCAREFRRPQDSTSTITMNGSCDSDPNQPISSPMMHLPSIQHTNLTNETAANRGYATIGNISNNRMFVDNDMKRQSNHLSVVCDVESMERSAIGSPDNHAYITPAVRHDSNQKMSVSNIALDPSRQSIEQSTSMKKTVENVKAANQSINQPNIFSKKLISTYYRSDVSIPQNERGKARRLSNTIGSKIDLVHKLANVNDRQTVNQIYFESGFKRFNGHGFKDVVAQYHTLDPKARPPNSRFRMKGGGAKTTLSVTEEQGLKQWIIDKRRSPLHERVDRPLIRKEALARFGKLYVGFQASDRWLDGFLDRNGLSLRLRTTTKKVTDAEVQRVADEFRRRNLPLLLSKYPSILVNTDETPVLSRYAW